jgi:hypothetical protein
LISLIKKLTRIALNTESLINVIIKKIIKLVLTMFLYHVNIYVSEERTQL